MNKSLDEMFDMSFKCNNEFDNLILKLLILLFSVTWANFLC